MSPVFPARRRAEEFAALVEDASTRTAQARSAELDRFLEVVATLRSAPPVEARPEFVSSLRERLMAAADTELAPAGSGADDRLTLPVRRPRDRRIAAAVGGMAIVGATTSMALAAESALPGDTLYPLKRAIENIQTGVAVDEGERGVTMLANAEGRLEEIESLSREGRIDEPDVAADTFNTFSDQAIEATDLVLSDYAATGQQDLITELYDFTAESLDTLVRLEAVIPEEARDELLRAAMVLRTIDAEASQACPECAGGIVEFPAVLQAAHRSARHVSTTAVDAVPTANDEQSDGAKNGAPAQQEQGGGAPAGGEGTDLGAVLPQPSGGGQQETGGNEEETSNDPIGDLTGSLTGGDSQTTGNDGGSLVLPDVDEELDDVLDPLNGSD